MTVFWLFVYARSYKLLQEFLDDHKTARRAAIKAGGVMRFYIRPVYPEEMIEHAKDAAKVMHPDYIWPGLCNQLKRTPSISEWNKVIEDSPFIRKEKTEWPTIN